MRRALRESFPCALAAAAGSLALAWLGLYGPGWNDYEAELRPAVEALVAGHLHAFLSLSPVYGGSLIERAPFALLPGLWGAGEPVLYRFLALPCLLASALLAVWILARMRAEGRPLLARAVTLGLLAANPIALRALEVGHPEEILGASLCVAAVLLASSPRPGARRALLAGVLLGLAVANKQWALLAAGPALLALPRGRRAPAAAAAMATAALIEAPLLLAGGGGYLRGAGTLASSPSPIFQPWQVFWFLGRHGALVHGLFGEAKPGYRDAPAWAGQISHPLVLLAGAAVALWLWRATRGRRLPVATALLALAVTMLLRCLLDTWDTAYYLLPAIFALTAWEASAAERRPPLLSLCLTVAVWAQFQWLPGRISPDAQAAVFLLWTLVLLAALARRLAGELPGAVAGARGGRRHAGPEGRPRLGMRGAATAQAMTVSSFASPVRTSRPPSRTTTRSSIRTPSAPGR